MSAPLVRGWCPGAHRPMMSGDGLVVRVRPRLGRLSADEVRILADLATRHGSGAIDVTTRANLQLRGVSEAAHPALLAALIAEGLTDPDATLDARRNIIATPFWSAGDLTDRLGRALEARLADFPEMPAKVGFALDTGPEPMLSDASADFRLERDGAALILRADGAGQGVPVTEETAIDAMLDMARWFTATGGPASGRMKRHLKTTPVPAHWTHPAPHRETPPPAPGQTPLGALYGVPFGQTTAADLTSLLDSTEATHLRITPWRMILAENAAPAELPAFIAAPGEPRLGASACPGAPFCPQATVPTRALAARLAPFAPGLHVSGCAKGCARQAAAPLTLVGCDGAWDVVRDGTAWDTPLETGLTETQILDRFAR